MKKLRDALRDFKLWIVKDAEKRPGDDLDQDWRWLGNSKGDHKLRKDAEEIYKQIEQDKQLHGTEEDLADELYGTGMHSMMRMMKQQTEAAY